MVTVVPTGLGVGLGERLRVAVGLGVGDDRLGRDVGWRGRELPECLAVGRE